MHFSGDMKKCVAEAALNFFFVELDEALVIEEFRSRHSSHDTFWPPICVFCSTGRDLKSSLPVISEEFPLHCAPSILPVSSRLDSCLQDVTPVIHHVCQTLGPLNPSPFNVTMRLWSFCKQFVEPQCPCTIISQSILAPIHISMHLPVGSELVVSDFPAAFNVFKSWRYFHYCNFWMNIIY
jgi:hypothetical protein